MLRFAKYTNEPNFVGYPLYYLLDSPAYYDTRILCADCCSEEYNEDDGDQVEHHVNFENHMLFCQECDTKIEAAYEEDDEDDDYVEPYHVMCYTCQDTYDANSNNVHMCNTSRR